MKKKIVSVLFLGISDLIVIFASFILAYYIRIYILNSLFYKFALVQIYPFSVFLEKFFVAIVWIIIFAHEKLYTKRFTYWEEFRVLFKSSTVSFSLIMILIFITRSQLQFSRTIVVLSWIISLILFPLFRFLTKILLVNANLWKKKLIILGVQQTSLSILKHIKKNKTMGYEIVCFLDNDPKKLGKKYLGIKVLGSIADLENITKTHKSKDIMVATPHLPRTELKELLSKCESISESMWLIPRGGDFITEGVDIEVIGNVLTLYIKKNLAKPWNIFIKNLFDKIFSLILLIPFLPIFIIISIAIKLDSKGPAIFKQKRLGQGKEMFSLYKFRSMSLNNESKLRDYLSQNENARKEWEEYKKLKGYDPRLTKVGRLIRKFSLDELPQLLNVLQGKMSFVGPRPYIYEEIEDSHSFVNIIIKVKPGITGLWQISGRSELSFKQRLALDEYYIRNWSLWLDIGILLQSIKVIFSSKGAY